MEIIKQTTGMTKKDAHRLSSSNSISLKTLEAQFTEVTVTKYLEYSEINNSGNEVTILSFITDDGSVYSTNSKTFIEAFNKIIEDLGEPDPDAGEDGWIGELKIIKDISRNNRTFFTCEMIN